MFRLRWSIVLTIHSYRSATISFFKKLKIHFALFSFIKKLLHATAFFIFIQITKPLIHMISCITPLFLIFDFTFIHQNQYNYTNHNQWISNQFPYNHHMQHIYIYPVFITMIFFYINYKSIIELNHTLYNQTDLNIYITARKNAWFVYEMFRRPHLTTV